MSNIHRFTNEHIGPDHCDTCARPANVHREYLGDGEWVENWDGTYSRAIPLGILGPRNWREWFMGFFR